MSNMQREPDVQEKTYMARPSITRVQKRSRKPRQTVTEALNAETAASDEEVPRGINLIAHHLANLTTKLDAIADALVKRTGGEEVPGPTQITSVLARLEPLEAFVKSIPVSLDLSPLLKRIETLEAAAVSTPRRRKSDAEPATAPAAPREGVAIKNNDVVDQGTPVPEKPAKKPDRATCSHPTKVEIGNNLLRCEVCGATLDKPASQQTVTTSAAPAPSPAQTTAPAVAPAPTPAAASPLPSVDDLRAVAITWIGKHSKEKFAEVLKKYGATNLSTVPEEQRAALMAELNGAK
jgi:hypothetical protein